ncbi:MAG: HIT domain-containing protein [Bdellovibrionota bacterium]
MSGLKHLFTPWRMKFIKEGKQTSGCVLCDLVTQQDGPENLVLYRSTYTYVVMNKFPYNTGHIMVVPFVHGSDVTSLSPEVMQEMMLHAQKMMQVLTQTHQPEGFNMGVNVGRAGGAGIPDHLHFHVVPRWTGDTNFMPLFSQTRVLPETVEQTYQRIKQALSS